MLPDHIEVAASPDRESRDAEEEVAEQAPIHAVVPRDASEMRASLASTGRK